ncbi:MAG: hypothetical protein E4H36_04450 [Spirochaetales bacterium]|nr:MAG: hypothetical protein E4H36_04450 [Spirochaetales bacterium]
MHKDAIFQDLRIVDNFYQTSSFYPMPVVLVGSLAENGQTNIGPYSLCFPYYIAGKGYYAMVLEARNSSNTAQNILRTGRASINFIPDKRKYMKQAAALGYPGDTTEEKMKNCAFTLMGGLSAKDNPGTSYPQIVAESFQVYECTWIKELDGAGQDRPQESYALIRDKRSAEKK